MGLTVWNINPLSWGSIFASAKMDSNFLISHLKLSTNKNLKRAAVGLAAAKKNERFSPQGKQYVNWGCCTRQGGEYLFESLGKRRVMPAPRAYRLENCNVLFARLGCSGFGPRTLLLYWLQGLVDSDKTFLAGTVE